MNPYLTQRANRRWWVYPLMALFFALSALLLWRTCKAGEHGDTRMVLLLLCLATACDGSHQAKAGQHQCIRLWFRNSRDRAENDVINRMCFGQLVDSAAVHRN